MSDDGRFVWYELMTTDPEAAKRFYGDVIGWTVQDWPGPNPYSVWQADGTGMGGLMALPAELRSAGVPPHWMGYVHVADVDRATARAKDLGGAVRVPPTDIPEVGRFAVLADPQGATIALLAPQGEGTAPDQTKVAFVGWHELSTTDHEAAWAFYSGLFGWKQGSTMDMGEMGPYVMYHHPADAADRSLGGISDLAKIMGVHPHWLYYVNVADLDGAMERVKRGGGQVENGPSDVPGGRVAQCQDPQGVPFAMFQLG